MNEKILKHHLDRAAYVYVRQSTNRQVRDNHQGRQRQYDLAERARELSFARVVVIDDDQGKDWQRVGRTSRVSIFASSCLRRRSWRRLRSGSFALGTQQIEIGITLLICAP